MRPYLFLFVVFKIIPSFRSGNRPEDSDRFLDVILLSMPIKRHYVAYESDSHPEFFIRKNSNEIPLNAQHRIIGGVNASIYDFSYQVSVQVYQQHTCGGAILDSKFIVTAAHCFSSKKLRPITIRAGSDYIRKGGTVVKVCTVTIHKNYNDTTMDNDIAVLTLCQPLNFSKSVAPIGLPSPNLDLKPGTMTTVSGWGYVEEEGVLSPTLRKVDVPIVSLSVCRKKYKYVSVITPGHICAGFTNGGKDSCQGDSGGPLVVNGTLVGIVSYGLGCAREYPGIYTNVAKYMDWIHKQTNLTRIENGSNEKHWYDGIVGWFKNSSNNNENCYVLTAFCLLGLLLK